MEEVQRRYRRIHPCRTATVHGQESGKQHPRRSHITKAEIDFCVNCEKKTCNGNRCKELKAYLKGVRL